MIKTLFAVLIIFLVFGCSNNSKHIGEWKGKNKHISFFIKDDGRIMIVNNNEVMDYRYEIDYTKNPIWLDLLLNEKGEKEVRVKGIIRFITDIKIEFRRQSNPTGQRFDSFDYLDKEHTLVLDKVHK